jgi:hypothetical protein
LGEEQARTEGKDGWHLDHIMVQMLDAPLWATALAILVHQGTTAHLEQEQRKLVRWELISQRTRSPQSPPVLPAQLVAMATTSAYRSAADAKDHRTPKQAPQAANAWRSTESSCAMSANVFAKQAMWLLMAPLLTRIQTSTVKRWSTRGAAQTSSLIPMVSVGLQTSAKTNAMEATEL